MWHIAALVGPFHAKDAYMAVNYGGTLNVIDACRYAGAFSLACRHVFLQCTNWTSWLLLNQQYESRAGCSGFRRGSLHCCNFRPAPRVSFILDRKHGVGKLIMSSSPSTRFDGNDIDGLKEDDLSVPKKFVQVMHKVPFVTLYCRS